MLMVNLYLDLLVYAIAIFSVGYAIYLASSKRMAKLFLFFVAAAILFYFEHASMFLLSGVIIFESAAFYHGSRKSSLFVAAGMIYLLAAVQLSTVAFAIQAVLVGLLAGTGLQYKPFVQNKKIEIRRDIFQIAAGVLIIACFFVFSIFAAQVITAALVLIGIVFSNFAARGSRSRIAVALRSLERSGAHFGSGAMWLALGTLVAISFTSNIRYIVPILIAIFFCDSTATIVGINFGRHKLPYNKKKSIEGFLAYFIIMALASYALLGAIALLLAIIAAFVESAPLHIDDNFDVPIVLLIALLLIKIA